MAQQEHTCSGIAGGDYYEAFIKILGELMHHAVWEHICHLMRNKLSFICLVAEPNGFPAPTAHRCIMEGCRKPPVPGEVLCITCLTKQKAALAGNGLILIAVRGGT